MELQQLLSKKQQILDYIEHGHDKAVEALTNEEGIGRAKAKIDYDGKISEAKDEFERELISIHNSYPASQDPRRISKEKIALLSYENKIKKAKEEYDREIYRVTFKANTLRKCEFLDLKYAKENLEKINIEIAKLQVQRKKQDASTM